MPGGKREGPNAFMEGESTVLSHDLSSKAQVDLSVHGRWAGSSSAFPQVGTRGAKPSKRMLGAERVPSGGSSVVLPPL